MHEIGKRIKERRLLLNLKAEDLAPMVGLSAATIYRYENGDIKKVNTNKLRSIARALETNELYLMGWSDKPDLDVAELEKELYGCLEDDEDDELYELREELRRNPEIRMLFSASKNAKPEHIKAAAAMLNALKGNENGLE